MRRLGHGIVCFGLAAMACGARRAPLAADSQEEPRHLAPAGSPSSLPNLPPPSNAARRVDMPLRRSEPPSPCTRGLGWDGWACVPSTCPVESRFKSGSGCVPCIGECEAERSERRYEWPWRDDPGVFDPEAARVRLSTVSMASCSRSEGPSGRGLARVTFRASGLVGAVALDAPFNGTDVGDCVGRKLANVRVPSFGGTSASVSVVVSVP